DHLLEELRAALAVAGVALRAHTRVRAGCVGARGVDVADRGAGFALVDVGAGAAVAGVALRAAARIRAGRVGAERVAVASVGHCRALVDGDAQAMRVAREAGHAGRRSRAGVVALLVGGAEEVAGALAGGAAGRDAVLEVGREASADAAEEHREGEGAKGHPPPASQPTRARSSQRRPVKSSR